jgi:hypothetical protein
VAFDWTNPATQQFIAKTCASLDAATFVVPTVGNVGEWGCKVDPCPVQRTTCIVADLGAWLAADCSGSNDPDCKCASQRVPVDDARYPSTYLANYGISRPASADCFRTATTASCIPTDKANQALWDFYHASDYRDTKLVGFGLDGATDCTSIVDVNTDETVVYCAPNPAHGVKYLALRCAFDRVDHCGRLAVTKFNSGILEAVTELYGYVFVRCVWSFRARSPGKDWHFPFKLSQNCTKNSKRTIF